MLLVSTLGGSIAQTCADGDDTCTAKDSNNNKPQNNDPKRQVRFENKSIFRIDIYYDDGRFGKLVTTVSANGGSSNGINTFVGHRFFATMHGVREGLVDPATDEQFFFTVDDTVNDFVIPEDASTSKTRCRDRYPACKNEAARGECTNNPGWMIVNCCVSCEEKEGYGHLIDSDVRCTRERLNATEAAFDVGSLNELFTSWATEEKFQQYDPHVISSPGKSHGAEHDGPWILTFDSFFDDEEIEALIEGAGYTGFQRSTDQGKVIGSSGEKEKVVSKTRTSSNSWCRHKCESLPGVRRVSDRIEEVTGIPQGNYESFQILKVREMVNDCKALGVHTLIVVAQRFINLHVLRINTWSWAQLKYQAGEFYRRHHDSSGKNKNVSGHRILTFFLYLNDVEEGGETAFTDLGIAVKPKKGRALIWPSVLNDDPESSDYRTYHEARAVIKGTKYAANHWIHQYNYRNANVWGCGGSFA